VDWGVAEELLRVMGLQARYDPDEPNPEARWRVSADRHSWAEAQHLDTAVWSMVRMAAEAAGWVPRRES